MTDENVWSVIATYARDQRVEVGSREQGVGVGRLGVGTSKSAARHERTVPGQDQQFSLSAIAVLQVC